MLCNGIIKTNRHNVFPLYHTVSDRPLPHIGILYQVRTVKQFEQDLDVLCRHFIPATMDECAASPVKNKRPLFHLTFDDGLRECSEIIQPILLKKGIPATFFINNDFIDNRKLFYRFAVALILRHSSTTDLTRVMSETALPAAVPHETLLRMTHRDEHTLNIIAEKLDIDIPAYLNEKQPYMTTDEIKAMLKNGFTIGSHSCGHADFSVLSPEEIKEEIKTSVKDINLRFNIKCSSFSFPFTNHMLPEQLFNQMQGEMPELKYFFGTSGMKEDIPGVFQRIPFEKNNRSATAILVRQIAKYRLLKMAGRQRVKRND
jgi:hypothetical protein